jgi:hypothetical protein
MFLNANGAPLGLPFDRSSAHVRVVDNLCVDCHMAEPPTGGSGRVGGHTFAMRHDMGSADPSDDVDNVQNACGPCHTLTTYDRTARGDYDGDGAVEGIQTEVRGLMQILRDRAFATIPNLSEDSHGKLSLSSSNYAKLSFDQKSAFYNYNFVLQDGSYGIHNTSFSVQLLQRSYYGFTGRPIDVDYPDMTIRGPIQPTRAGNWSDYR